MLITYGVWFSSSDFFAATIVVINAATALTLFIIKNYSSFIAKK